MTPDATLTRKVEQLRQRARLLVTQRWAIRALIAGTASLALVAAGWRLAVGWAPSEQIAVALAVVALGGLLFGWTRPVTALDAARLADRRLKLRERLSSGVQFMERGERSGLVAAQIEDAAKHSEAVQVRDVLPYRLPREARWLGVTAVVLLGVLILPDLPMFQSPKRRAETAALKHQGAKLQRLSKEVTPKRLATNAEIARRIAENMRNLGVGMERGRVDKRQAMVGVHKLTKELREAQRQLAAPAAAKSLDQAAAELKQAALDPRLAGAGQASRSMADLARALEKKDYEATARALRDLESRLKRGELSEQEAKAAAAALDQMAKALKDTDLDAAARQLAAAAKQLKDAEKLAKGLTKEQAERLRRLMAQRASTECGKAGGT